MKNLYLLIAVMLSWLGGSAQCVTNGGFEDGATSDYSYRRNDGGGLYVNDCDIDTSEFINFTPGTSNNTGNVGGTIVTAGNDPTLNALSITVPRVHSGNKAMKLNRPEGNTDATSLSQEITPTGTVISFHYSLIIQNPHPDEPRRQPFFTARLLNDQGEVVNINSICIKGDVTNPLFLYTDAGTSTVEDDLIYTNWQCAILNIPEEYVGVGLTLEFVVADCGYYQHFGLVYIDDITCDASCTEPAFGLIQLDPVSYCPEDTFEVCGTYVAPLNGTLTSGNISLEIRNENNSIIETITGPVSFTSDSFCFEVSLADFGSTASGSYEFRVNADFEIDNGIIPPFILTLFDPSAVDGPDIGIINIHDSNVIGNTLHWEDMSDSYTLEFVGDGECCPGSSVQPAYYTVTTTENELNLDNVIAAMQQKCFRWRIKTDCGWSGWCCLADDDMINGSYDNFPNADYGNIHGDDCYPNPGLDCEPCITETVNVSGSTFSFRHFEECVIAVNDIILMASAVYLAEDYIILNPGFLADTGTKFLANIEDCTVEEMPVATYPARRNMSGKNDLKNTKGIAEYESGFTVFPNPTDNLITVSSKVPAMLFTITDITGKHLMDVGNSTSATTVTIDLSGLNSGIYFLSADGKTIQKIVKN